MTLLLFLHLLMSSCERSQRVLNPFTGCFGLTADCRESQSLAEMEHSHKEMIRIMVLDVCGHAYKEDVWLLVGSESWYREKVCVCVCM